MQKQTLLSATKPTGTPHIGNLIGAFMQWVEMQNQYDTYIPVMDMHAITAGHDPKTLRDQTLQMVKLYIAFGIDQKKSTFFIQSHVSAHAELCWILNCIARVPEIERMTQYKDALSKGKTATVGLFDYPVLMAADILLYHTNLVPVGDDQKQHVELARNLAERFNKTFGEIFTIPSAKIVKERARIMSLLNPREKMSKSDTNQNGCISLLDAPDVIRKKIQKAVTDSGTEIIYSEEKPALKNLLVIYSALGNITIPDIEKLFWGKGYKEFKESLAEVVVNALKPIQEKYASLSDDEVLTILKDGAEKARGVANKTLREVKEKVGFIQ